MRFTPYFPRWLDNALIAVIGTLAAAFSFVLYVVFYVTASIPFLPVWAVQFVYSQFQSKD